MAEASVQRQLPSIIFPVQSFRVSWLVVSGGVPVSCSQAGVRNVSLVARLASEPAQTYRFPCLDGEGVTEAIRSGTYQHLVRLEGEGGVTITETLERTLLVREAARAEVREVFDLSPRRKFPAE